MNRTELEEAVWQLPRIQESGIDFAELESMTDSELLALLGHKKPPKKEKPKREPVKRYPAPRCVSFEYVEREGRLMRLEKWQHWGAGGSWFSTVAAPVGKRVQWQGRTVSASLVLHWVRTGEMVQRVPRAAKPFRGLVRVAGRLVHLGYFATVEERAEAVGLAKLGIFPNGSK